MKTVQSRPFTLSQDCTGHTAEVAEMVRTAFAQQYGSGDGEVALIAALGADGDVSVEIAAWDEGEIVGHVLFSRMTANPPVCRIAALAPVAVRIDRQNQGIGDLLIRAGLAACRENGIDAVIVIVLGDPPYYQRFGFDPALAAHLTSPYAGPHLQALEFRAGTLRGVRSVAHAPAFARMDG
jgi:putative acetyltransferase